MSERSAVSARLSTFSLPLSLLSQFLFLGDRLVLTWCPLDARMIVRRRLGAGRRNGARAGARALARCRKGACGNIPLFRKSRLRCFLRSGITISRKAMGTALARGLDTFVAAEFGDVLAELMGQLLSLGREGYGGVVEMQYVEERGEDLPLKGERLASCSLGIVSQDCVFVKVVKPS